MTQNKINKRAVDWLQGLIDEPGSDPYRYLTSKDAEVILGTLGIKPYPEASIRNLKECLRAGPAGTIFVTRTHLQRVVDYIEHTIKQLDEAQQ